MRTASGRRNRFSIQIGDNFLECRDRLLNSGNLHQFPAAHGAASILQRNNQISPLLLQLN